MCIFALNILDQLRFDTSRVRKFDNANGHFFQRGDLGGTQPPRSGNDLVLVILDSADKQGLQHALRLETGCLLCRWSFCGGGRETTRGNGRFTFQKGT
jgi:hypothetical protein